MSPLAARRDVLHASEIRSVVLAIWAIVIAFTPYERYAYLSTAHFTAIGIGQLIIPNSVLQLLLDRDVLLTLKWSTLASLLCLILWPRRFRALTLFAVPAVVVLDALTKSIGGYANHAQIIPLLLLLLVGLFARTPFLSPMERRPITGRLLGARHDYPALIWLSRLIIAIPYTYVGLARLASGASMFTTGALDSHIRINAGLYSAYGFRIAESWLRVPELAASLRVGFAVTTIFEALSLLAIVSPRFRWLWTLAMTLFHFVALVTMNIFFWENTLLLWSVFIGHGELGRRTQAWRSPSSWKIRNGLSK